MDFPINIDTISMGPSIFPLRDHRYNFLNDNLDLSLQVVLILANSADSDEMQHYAAFHLGLHCLPKCPFRGFQNTRTQFILGPSNIQRV